MATPFDFTPAASQTFPQPVGVTVNAVVNPITPGQVAYLTDLMTRKAALVDGDVAKIAPWVSGLSKTAASDRISELKEWLRIHDGGQSPRRDPSPSFDAAELPSADLVPEGRYAIATTSADAVNALAFYKVDRPTEGRWAGRVFVKLVTGGDEQRLSWATSKSVLAQIAADGAQAAMLRYGREIGNCGHCGRQLTNDESRELGIGPVCRGKMGF